MSVMEVWMVVDIMTMISKYALAFLCGKERRVDEREHEKTKDKGKAVDRAHDLMR